MFAPNICGVKYLWHEDNCANIRIDRHYKTFFLAIILLLISFLFFLFRFFGLIGLFLLGSRFDFSFLRRCRFFIVCITSFSLLLLHLILNRLFNLLIRSSLLLLLINSIRNCFAFLYIFFLSRGIRFSFWPLFFFRRRSIGFRRF